MVCRVRVFQRQPWWALEATFSWGSTGQANIFGSTRHHGLSERHAQQWRLAPCPSAIGDEIYYVPEFNLWWTGSCFERILRTQSMQCLLNLMLSIHQPKHLAESFWTWISCQTQSSSFVFYTLQATSAFHCKQSFSFASQSSTLSGKGITNLAYIYMSP